MSDANPVAPAGEALPRPGQPYTLAIRLHAGGIGMIAVCSKPGSGGKQFAQRLYRLNQLVRHLPGPEAPGDWYLSLNAFKRHSRRIQHLVSLRGSFVDLDTYILPAWAKQSPEVIWAAIRTRLASTGIPLPQVVLFSGRGLQAIWVYPKGLPAGVLPRWRAVQKHLADGLKGFAPDLGALDASRIVRLPGTINSKSGRRTYFVHLDLDGATDFEALAEAILPMDRYQLRNRRQRKAAARAARSTSGRAGIARHFVAIMLADIRRLIDHRWGGQIPEQHRNTTLFVYGCFLVRQTGLVGLPDALLSFGLTVCDLDEHEMEQIAGSIAAKIHCDNRGYRFSVAGAAEKLGITREDVLAGGLVRLHPSDPELDAARRAARQAQDRDRKRKTRLTTGVRPQANSLARIRPWASQGLSRSTWFRRRRRTAFEVKNIDETDLSRTIGGGTPILTQQ